MKFPIANLQKAYPHIIAIVIFIVLGLAYFYPQLEGYVLKQSDYSQYLGMSKEIYDYREVSGKDPLWTNSMFGGMPAYQINVERNTDWARIFQIKFVFKILGNPLVYLFLSMLGAYLMLVCFNVSPWLSIIGAIAFGFSSINMLYLGAGHITKVHSIALLPPIIGGIFYSYRKNFIVGGVLTALFLSLHLSANHIQETYYLIYLILGIAVVEFIRFAQKKEFVKFFKISVVLALFAVIGVLPTVNNLLSTNEYSKHTTRGKSELTISTNDINGKSQKGLDSDYIKQYSMGVGEVMSIAIPNVKGGASGALGYTPENLTDVDPQVKEGVAQSSSYWGEQLFTGGAFYFGAIMTLLAILGLVFVKDKIKWALLFASILAIMLSWKHGALLDYFIQNVPLFSKFRDTKMMLVLVQLSMPLLSVLFLKELLEEKIELKKLLYVTGGILFVFFLIYVTPATWFSFFSQMEEEQFANQISLYQNNPQAISYFELFQHELQEVRISIFKQDAQRTLLFMIVAAALVALFALKKLKKTFLIAGLAVLVLVDLWSVDKRYLNNEKSAAKYAHWEKEYDKYNPYQASVADKAILQMELSEKPDLKQQIEENQKTVSKEIPRNYWAHEKEKIAFRDLNLATSYRVYNLQNPFNSTVTSYYHKSIGGYHGAKLKKYQELIDFRIQKETEGLIGLLQNAPTMAALDSFLLSGMPTLNMLNTKYIIYNPGAQPLVNNNANGNVWFVKNVNYAESADDEITALNTINPKETAVVNSADKEILARAESFAGQGTIFLTSYKPNHLKYESNSAANELAVFSEIYYPEGWNAYIDGKQVDYVCANYTLRALPIPAGMHTVEFKFEPQTYHTGQTVSLIGSILLLLLIAGVVYIRIKKIEVGVV